MLIAGVYYSDARVIKIKQLITTVKDAECGHLKRLITDFQRHECRCSAFGCAFKRNKEE